MKYRFYVETNGDFACWPISDEWIPKGKMVDLKIPNKMDSHSMLVWENDRFDLVETAQNILEDFGHSGVYNLALVNQDVYKRVVEALADAISELLIRSGLYAITLHNIIKAASEYVGSDVGWDLKRKILICAERIE